MAPSPLVSTAWLEQHLADPDLRIIEVCNIRDDKAYREGHIPGALWFYWKTACWHETDRDFVTPAAMAKAVRQHRHRPADDHRAVWRSRPVR